ncbi:hypothetical protein DEQ92_20940 [Haloferax sp. Atlit-6N]|uniref:hypothetical protein n=1 Tax=Haloferacaceae TaxID=1644056 RepID=UPI000E21C1EC|nr:MULTISPECIES: hypothetical protein [Haloferacaceae]RDZ99259.1 hypothetical protein DEQ92_20940 [Haloferax sp. Atlit-6N]RLM83710.1 hypothetical protein D3D02_17050 [Halobellus sp. Atlit-38R]
MAIRFSRIVLLYFVLGAVMFGGGAVSYDDSGVTKYFIDQDGDDVEAGEQPSSNLQGVAGAITSLVGQVGGATVLVWNLAVGVVSFLNWPVVVFIENGAPPTVTVLLGGAPTVMFYGSLVTLVRSSA